MKRVAAVLLAATVVMTACDPSSHLTEAASSKTVLTLCTSHTDGKFLQFERLVESTYAIDLRVEQLPSSISSGELARRMRNESGPDLVLAGEPSDLLKQGYMLDLSGFAFCARYERTIMDTISEDGRVGFVPVPGLYHGYLYNETLFQELDIQTPTSGTQLAAALVQLAEQRYADGAGAALGLNASTDYLLGNYMLSYAVPDFLSSVPGIKWTAEFLEGERSFSGPWEPILTQLSVLDTQGALAVKDLDQQRRVNTARDLATGKIAVAYCPGWYPDRMDRYNAQLYEQGEAPAQYTYRMLPYLSRMGRGAWTTTTPEGYLGISRALTARGAEDRLAAALDVMDLVSTPAGQAALNADIGGSISYLQGCTLPSTQVPRGLERVVDDGYVYHMQFPSKLVSALGNQTNQLLRGVCTPKQAAQEVDRLYDAGLRPDPAAELVVGQMEVDALNLDYGVRARETELGNLAADAIREMTGAQIAVINGGGLRSSLYHGDVTMADLQAVSPFDNKIIVVSMPGRVMHQMFENAVSKVDASELVDGRFLQVSGVQLTYSESAAVGQRVQTLKLENGSPIQPDLTYTVAINDYMAGRMGYDDAGNGDEYQMLNLYCPTIPQSYLVQLVQETQCNCKDALAAYFEKRQGKALRPIIEGRIAQLP